MAEKETQMVKQDIPTRRMRLALIWSGVALGVLILFIVVGVHVLGVSLGGLSQEDANKRVQTTIDSATTKGFSFRYIEKTVTIGATLDSTNPDLARDVIHFDVDRAVNTAYAVGHTGSLVQQIAEQFRARLHSQNIPVAIAIDRQGLSDALVAAFQSDMTAPRNAELHMVTSTNAGFQPEVTPEQPGTVLQTDDAITILQTQAAKLSFQTIYLKSQNMNPTLTKSDLDSFIKESSNTKK